MFAGEYIRAAEAGSIPGAAAEHFAGVRVAHDPVACRSNAAVRVKPGLDAHHIAPEQQDQQG